MIAYYFNIVTVPVLIAFFIYFLFSFMKIYVAGPGNKNKKNRYIEAHTALEAKYPAGLEFANKEQLKKSGTDFYDKMGQNK